MTYKVVVIVAIFEEVYVDFLLQPFFYWEELWVVTVS